MLDQDFNIAAAQATSIANLAEQIWTQLGDGREFAYTAEETDASRHTSQRREADTTKLQSVVTHRATVTLAEGIAKTTEWVRTKI